MAGYRSRPHQEPVQYQGQIRNDSTSCLHFRYAAVASATKNFDQRSVSNGGCKLGEGGFGPVFKGELRFTEVAIKVLRRAPAGNKSASELATEQFDAEIQVLSKFRHPNLVTLIGYTNEPGLPRCLIYEFMPNGTLEDVLDAGAESRKQTNIGDERAGLPWMARLSIALDTARGLSFLHTAIEETPLVHRDVKSANVLLDYSFRAKVGDFGLVRAIGHDPNAQIKQSFTARIVGTSGYIAPEYFRGKITTKLDTYAFGVVLFEVLTGLPSYDSRREHAELVSHIEALKDNPSFKMIIHVDPRAGAWPSTSFNGLTAIAERCLDINYDTRPEMIKVYEMLEQLTTESCLDFNKESGLRTQSSQYTNTQYLAAGSSRQGSVSSSSKTTGSVHNHPAGALVMPNGPNIPSAPVNHHYPPPMQPHPRTSRQPHPR